MYLETFMEKKEETINKGGEEYAYLIFALIVFLIVVLGWVLLFSIEKAPEKPEGKLGRLEGEFFTLGLWGERDVVLDILGFNISENNETINLRINWSSGADSFDAILIIFNGAAGDCNYTSTDLPEYGIIKNYDINITDTSCTVDFSEVASITVLAGVDVILTQISVIENITLYINDNSQDIINLSDYFSCIEDISYSAVENPENSEVRAEINSTTNRISIYYEPGWSGTQKFDLSASCEGEALDVSNSGENMSFYVIVLNETRVVNTAPVFLNEECGNLEVDFGIVIAISINLEDCFNDSDGDVLSFRFDNSSMEKISVVMGGSYLTLTPEEGFIGSESFYIYADDGVEEIRSNEINVNVFDSSENGETEVPVLEPDVNISVSIPNEIETTSEESRPRITGAEPVETEINVSYGKKMNFSITAENYDKIEWYLNGELVAGDVGSYEASDLEVGSHEIGVRVKKGDETETKIWNVNIYKKEIGKKNLLIIFIVIVVFFGLVIVVIVLLIIQGMRERYGIGDREIKLDRGPIPEYPRDVPS